MKILILKNNVSGQSTLDKGLEIVKQQASSIGLDLNLTQMTISKSLTSLPFSNDVNKNGYYLNPSSYLGTWNIGYDIVCCVFDASKVNPSPTNPSDNGSSISIPIQWYTTYPEVFSEFLLHELCHYFFNKTGKPDITHNYEPAFTQLPRKDWYLHLLKDLTQTTQMYKYFSQKEVEKWKLAPALWEKLDKAREYAGVPFVINSGFRTEVTNEEVGGVADSSHLNGLGVDLRARNSREHYLITIGLYLAGFRRISRHYPFHIHADIDPSKEQDVLF